MWILGVVIVLYVAIRLKKSRVVVNSRKSMRGVGKPVIKTPLHDLEKTALKILGKRNPGETFVVWLRKLKDYRISEAKLEEACALHQQLRFDPSPDETNSEKKLLQIARDLEKQIKDS
jgi:tRNA(Ser,Leu) C12 N-acetylase TAN1